jgi:Putative Ig domain
MRPKTMRRLAVIGVVLAVTGGALAHAGSARAATYLSVTLGGTPGPQYGGGQWDTVGDPVLVLSSPGSGTIATIAINNVPPAAPAEAPSFTTDNYSSGSPTWLMEFSGGGWLYGYPSNAGLGSSNWKAARGNCSTTTLDPAYGTYANTLAVLVNAGCAGDVTNAEIFADGNQYPASDTITNIQYNGQTLVPGPDIVTVTSPGTQTGMAGTAISTLWIKASSVKGDTVGKYQAAGLPPGLSINEWDGAITGTPTTAGAFTVTVTATDNGLTSGKATFRWQISPATGGYWLTTSAGNVWGFNAPWYGSEAGKTLPAPVVGVTADHRGYLLTTKAGNV